jgi:hypothetical protein
MTGQPGGCDPTARPALRLGTVVAALADCRVEWVLTGSCVLVAYGAELNPNDVDVTPALDPDNLARLAALLENLGARPAYYPDWPGSLSLKACAAWTPVPPTEPHLDHLYVTPLGMVDVVPCLCGTYDELLPAATTTRFLGHTIRVCDPAEVLARLEGRSRPKDLLRRTQYAEVAAAVHNGAQPHHLDGLRE